MKRNLFERAALAFVSALVVLGQLHADTLTGQVVNPSGAGVAGVTISLSNGGPTSVSGVNGLFTISVNPGTYDVAFIPGTTTLAPLELLNVAVSGTRNLGAVQLAWGYPITGTAKNQAGLAVAGGNVDVYDQPTGVKLFTPSDSTNALGQFQVVVPAGTMRVRVKPPVGLLLVAQEVRNVAVNAPISVGTITLPPGVTLSGTVVDAATNAPIAGADIDVDDALSGTRIVTPGDTTSATGLWSTIVPTGLVHVSYAPPAGTSYLGRETFNVPINGTTNLGSVGLSRGLLVSGTVLGPTGQPIANADLDVDTSPGNLAVFTPNDQTDAAGRFAVVVPAGTYRVCAEPQATLGLAGLRTAPLTITANTTLPAFNLQSGWPVTGTLTASDGSAEYGADLDVIDPATGDELVTPGDTTDAAGKYAMYVQPGTWHVRIATRKGSLSRVETLPSVVVQGPLTLDRQLQKAPVACYFGTTGIPTVGQGGPVLATFAFVNANATPSPTAISLVMIDPNGVELPLLQGLPYTVAPGQFGVAVNVPFVVPPVAPGLLGQRFRYELRFDDPQSGLEQDHDHFDFFIR